MDHPVPRALRREVLTAAAALVSLLFGIAVLSPTAIGDTPGTPDCTSPAPNPQPGTPAWYQRENDNAYCGEQRYYDTQSNPAFAAAQAQLNARSGNNVPEEDPFRDPPLWQSIRFRYRQVSLQSPSGQTLSGYLFFPCDASCHDHQPGLSRFDPPYPGVVVVHGGAANQEMYLWGAEGLAEAGYMVLTFQIPEPDNAQSSFHYPDTKAALNYFLSTPSSPTAKGEVNPLWRELDRRHIGLAGHSAGGVAVSQLGQEDPRVSAIVSWDRAQSSPMPPGLHIRTPALFLVADYLCQEVPVCVPEPFCKLQDCPGHPQAFTSPPDPMGPGNKDEDFRRVSGAGVDSMKVTLRAATHLDFTQFDPGTGSRYGAAVAFYYTLAWFDRYLKGSVPAFARLIGTTFDNSGDMHNISGGTYDLATGRNVPAFLAGQRVIDRLSFEFRSAYYFAGGRFQCADVRIGCPGARLGPRRPGAPAPGGLGPCVDRRQFSFTLHHPRGERITRARVLVNGRLLHVFRGRRLTRLTLHRLPQGQFDVKIVTRTNRGTRAVSTRTYRGCTKTAPRHRFRRAHRRRR